MFPPPHPRRHRRIVGALAVAGVLGAMLLAGPPGAPAAWAAPASDVARPTVDPAAPTPTAPAIDPPPVGRSPSGAVVGGDGLAGRGVVSAAGTPAVPAQVGAAGWLVADLDTGTVLAARDPHGRYYPASTLKTLTLLSLHDQLDPAAAITATAADVQMEGSKVGIVDGGSYPTQLLFEAMMMQSGNDVANALARAAGGTDRAIEAMTERAARLQAYDTVVGGPSGLDVAGQSSSPYDLALIMAQIVADPALVAIMATPTAVMPAVPPTYPAFEIQNENPIFGRYAGAIAAKTGFTDAAQHTFVAAAERDGRRLVVSLMFGQQSPVPMVDQATALLDWGFALPADTVGVGRLVRPGDPEATGTATSGVVAGTSSSAAARAVAVAVATGDAAPRNSGSGGTAPALAALAGIASAGVVFVLAARRRR